MTIDFGRTAADYARHRAGFPDAFFDRLLRDEIRPGDRVLDVGTGSGILSIAAKMLGAETVVACDFDPEAAREATFFVGSIGIIVGTDFLVPLRDLGLSLLVAVLHDPLRDRFVVMAFAHI